MTLSEQQRAFAKLLPRLIDQAHVLGFEVTLGEAYRSTEEAARLASRGKGIRRSLHTVRLAIDLCLFKNGVYLTRSEAYKPLGEWWELQHADAAWGGRFTRPDGNHFSLAWGGRK